MQDKLKSATDDTKLRFYIEYEYSESFQFFSLFKRSGRQEDLGIERCAEVSAIQYQDFYRQGSINTKESAMNRMIQFPKILLFELVEYPCEYPKYYIRIYEKRHLDSKIQSKNIYLYLKG